MRKFMSIAAALMLSACSTNYGLYKKGDEKHGQYGYVSTYLAIAAAIIVIGAASGDDDGLYGGGDSGGNGDRVQGGYGN